MEPITARPKGSLISALGGKLPLVALHSPSGWKPRRKRDSISMCKFCDRFWERFWGHTDAWERARSNDRELWSKESDKAGEILKEAAAMSETDPAALQLYLKAAEAGSVIAMGRVAWQYWTGTATAPDLAKAQEYYRRAIQGGSWTATIHYARLLDELGHHDTCDQVL